MHLKTKKVEDQEKEINVEERESLRRRTTTTTLHLKNT